MSLDRSLPSQDGHPGIVFPMTRVSKFFPQALHLYSYIGIFVPHILPVKQTNQYKDKSEDFQVRIFASSMRLKRLPYFFYFFLQGEGIRDFDGAS